MGSAFLAPVLSAMSNYPAITLFVILAFGFYSIPAIRRYIIRLKTIRERGCQPPRFLPQKDPIFGLDVAFRMFKSYREGQRSAKFKEQHEAL